MSISNKELIQKARTVMNPQRFGQCDVGGVACALVTEKGQVHLGVCIDVSCGIGFCAEHAAIAAMLMNGESRIEKIVALWGDKILPPCGRCREFMWQINPENAATEVLVEPNKTVTLKELLPYPCY
ncbi:MAG: cytidine deaminase [Patescibacteria group bacterium]